MTQRGTVAERPPIRYPDRMAGSRLIRLGAARVIALLAVVMLALSPIGAAHAHAGHLHGAKTASAGGHAAHAGCEAAIPLADQSAGMTELAAPDDPNSKSTAPHHDCCWTWHVSALREPAGLTTGLVPRSSPIIAANRTAPPDVVPERLPEPPRPFA